MGCCESTFLKAHDSVDKNRHHHHQHNHHNRQNNHPTQPSNGTDAAAADGAELGSEGVPAFSEFSLADLKAATNNFSSDFIVSESGEKAPNVVYKGRLQNGNNNRRWIAVKKFTKVAWPDPKQFAVRVCFQLSILIYSVYAVSRVSIFCFNLCNFILTG